MKSRDRYDPGITELAQTEQVLVFADDEVRFGGGSAFRGAKDIFIGMVFGEAGAAAFWLLMGIVLNALGLTYYPVRLFPA